MYALYYTALEAISAYSLNFSSWLSLFFRRQHFHCAIGKKDLFLSPHPFSVYSPFLSNFIFREEQHLLKVQIFCRQPWENWLESFFGANLWDLIFHQGKLHASKWQPNQDPVGLNKHAHPFQHRLSSCSVSILLDSSDSPEIIVSLGIQDTICKLHSVISRINYP